jgi:hypothetical protein
MVGHDIIAGQTAQQRQALQGSSAGRPADSSYKTQLQWVASVQIALLQQLIAATA